jgi:DNA polymerase-1
MPKTLYLVDGTSQLFRAYFALGHLSNAEGLPTNAVYGFTTMLRKLLREERPEYAAVAFDPPGAVFRHESYRDYKANRPPAPADLNVQVPYAKRVCEVLGVPVLELAGYEADDVIATFTRRATAAGFEVVVVASDKDLLQLVSDAVTVLDPAKNLRLNVAGVASVFGVPPERVRDVLGLMGDSVDNVPGVPGVGQKTAIAAVSTYGDLEAIVEHADRFVAAWAARDALVAALDEAAAAEPLAPATLARVRDAWRVLERSLHEWVAREPDVELRSRLEALLRALQAADLAPLEAALGGPGGRAARTLAPLKRELKGLDRGSSKRVWFAIHDHAEQARLSRRLATLQDEVPIEFDPQALALHGPDRDRARALFSALDFRTLVSDYAAEEATGQVAPALVEFEHEVVREPAALRALAAAARGAGGLAVLPVGDGAPALRARLVGLALAHRPGHGAYLPLAHEGLEAGDQLPLSAVRESLGELLAAQSPSKLGHDVKSAIHLLGRHDLPVSGFRLDTMVAAFLLQSDRSSYALERIAESHLAQHLESEADVLGSGAARRSPASVPVAAFAAFAARRAEAVVALEQPLAARLREGGLAELYERIDGPLLPLLARMERHGIRIDVELLARMSSEMEADLARARRAIHELAGMEFSIDSPKQLREVLFERLGLRSRHKTAKTGAASTDAQALDELAAEHAIARRILDYRELAKLKSTYVDALPRLVDPSTGRVHTSYDPTGAATGRLSSSDPNLQNIPVRTEAGRKIRAAFVADPGYTFLACDYSQIELRVLAHVSGDPDLIEAFRAGEDIHRHTASRVFGVLPELVDDTMRRRAKAVNFGLLYGMSASRLAREQGMSRAEAQRFVEAYFERFSKVRDYIERIRAEARREGAVRTLFGRVRWFPQLHQRTNRGAEEQALRAAVNTTLQGTAADLMKLAMLRVEEAIEGAGSGARMLLQVHDELLLEVPTSQLQRTAGLVREAMAGVWSLAVPLVVDSKSGRSWEEAT